MNDPENDFPHGPLSHLRTPPVDDAAHSSALMSSLAALREGRRTAASASSPRLAWGLVAGVAACLALVLAWWPVPQGAKKVDVAQMLTDMEQLFPGQLNSVIVDGPEVTVDTSAEPIFPARDQRVCLTISKAGGAIRVLTYSGRRVCMRMDGKDLCLTPLLKGDGTVFVLTDSQVFQQGDAMLASGHRLDMERMQEVRS